MPLDNIIEKKIKTYIELSIDKLDQSIGYNPNDTDTHIHLDFRGILKIYESLVVDRSYEDLKKSPVSEDLILMINQARNLIRDPQLMFSDSESRMKNQIKDNKEEAQFIIKKRIGKKIDKIKINQDRANEIINKNRMNKYEPAKITFGYNVFRQILDYGTSSNYMTVVNREKDKRYNDSYDNQRNLGMITTGIGSMGLAAGFFLTTPVTIAGYAIAQGSIMIGGGVLSALGIGACSQAYVAKKIGRDGHYSDLFQMAKNSFDYSFAGTELLRNLSGKIENMIINKIKEGVRDVRTPEQKKPINKLIDNFLSCKDFEATGIYKFDEGIQNILYLLSDLIYLHGSNPINIDQDKINFLDDPNFYKRFIDLPKRDREKFIDSTRNLIFSLLKESQEVLYGDLNIDDLAVELSKSCKESCLVM